MKIKITLLVVLTLMFWASPAMGCIELNDLPEFSYEIGQVENEPAQNNIEPEKQGFWAGRDPWTKKDTDWQIRVIITQIIDWAQTREIATNSDFYETNPILGENPTLHEVDRYFIACIAGNYLIAKALSKNWRRAWQSGSILFQINFIKNNYELDIGMKF